MPVALIIIKQNVDPLLIYYIFKAMNNSNKKLGTSKPVEQSTMKQNWEVMKPFVYFSVKAMGVIAGALISIVKLLPMLAPKDDKPKKDDRIINI